MLNFFKNLFRKKPKPDSAAYVMTDDEMLNLLIFTAKKYVKESSEFNKELREKVSNGTDTELDWMHFMEINGLLDYYYAELIRLWGKMTKN